MLSVHLESITYPNFEGASQERRIALAGDTLTFTNPYLSGGGGAAMRVWKRAK